MRSKKGKKIISMLAASILSASMVFGALISGSVPAYAAELNADDSSVKNWTNYLRDENGNYSTENVGRIWTDKTVSTSSITFDGSSLGQTTVNKQEGSDFLVALSALSSTSNIMTKTDKPLDIVLVLDMSGSMREEETAYEYTPVYTLSTRQTYYLEGGRAVEWRDEIKLPVIGVVIQEAGWYIGDTRVEPKTSASDNDPNHHQFYTRRSAGTFDKEKALKDAVNEFVNSTKTLNDGINDENKKHRISLVKFAGNESTNVGNGTYEDGRFTYNYSQIVNHLTSDMTQVGNNVSALSPAGATRADLGMKHAITALENSREGAQKAVIFFTDGQPNAGSGFDANIANDAISNAKSLKDTGTLVYSIGIFAQANPNITDDQFNGFMHGVSSNYPEATAYNRLGARKEGSNYYKAATNADDLNKIFAEIAGEIQESAQGSPTQTEEGCESHSGYITFKDELGAYVKCDGFTEIVFAGKTFGNASKNAEVDKDGNTVTTYKFTGKGDNNLYPEGDLEDILISVTSYDDISKGDLVEVKIPATMIPVRDFHITEDGKMTAGETHPIRILYNASVKDGVIEDVMDGRKVGRPALIKNPDEQFKAYLKNNKTEDGKVKFFSNMWSGGENGDTTATFEPAATNSFYKFTEDTQLFRATANGGKEAVNSLDEITISDKNEYFFEKSYYIAKDSGGDATKKTERSYIRITTLSNLNEWMHEKEGNVYIKKGTQRLLRINDFINTEKGQSNKTGTAKYRINPVWDDTMTNIVVNLGNNGLVTADAAGALSIAKTAQIAEGMLGPVDAKGNSTLDKQKFTFEVTADTADGEYTSVVFTKNADGSETAAEASTVTFKNNKATVELKNKERIEIYGLKYGAAFSVKETLQPAGFKQITPADNSAVAGTISEEISRANFVNEYSASPVTDVTSAHLGVTGTKKLDGRTFESDDVFKFVITPSQDNPGTAQHGEYILTLNGDTVQGKNTANLDFGTVSFDKPGQYIFRILEYLPSGGEGEELIPSVTYDSTNYRLTVNVKDNGEGKLEIESFNIIKRINQQAQDWETVFESPNGEAADKGYINFTNTYNVEKQAISLRGIKELSNKLLADYGDLQFGFSITAAGSKAIGDSGEYAKDKDQPLPIDAVASEEGVCIYKNGSGTGLISMPNITFGLHNIGKEYKYIISELQPTKNGKMDGEPLANAVKVGDKWTYKGITFDNTSTEIIIKVQTREVGGKDVIKATITSSEPGPTFEGGRFDFVFNNTYDANLTKEIALDGTKTIEGRSFAKGDSFTFKVEPQNGAPAPEHPEVTINPTSGKTKNFSFGNINFGIADMKGAVKQPDGTYKKEFTYKITEVNDKKAGFKYDTTPVMAKVTVIDNGEGVLSADVIYTKNDSPVENANFTNIYKSQLILGNVGGLKVSKTLTGRDMRKSDAFEFKIKGIETAGITSASEADAKLSDADKSFKTNHDSASGAAVVMKKFDAMKFTEADAGKTYSYEVTEVKGSLGGVTYDESKYVVAIEVIDNLDGTMHAVTTVTKGNNSVSYDSAADEVPVVAFKNRYKAADLTFDTARAQFEKSLIGRQVNKDDSFTFKVEKASFNGETTEAARNNMPLPRDKEVTLTGEQINGKFSFGEMTFTKAGVYKYNVTEVIPEEKIPGITYDESVLSVTATVVDDGNGNLLVQQIEVPDNRFENRYDTKPVEYDTQGTTAETKFTKVLEGREWKDDDLFVFTITPADGAPTPKDETDNEVDYIVVRKPASGKSTDFGFGKITFDKEGEYIYKVKEIEPRAENMIPGINYDDHEATLKITVRDNQKGNMEVTNVELLEGTFTNVYDSQNVTVDPSAKGGFSKELSGRSWKDGETFDFTISPKSLDGKTDADSIKKIPMPKKTVATAEKPVIGTIDKFNFGSITFAEVGTYVYEVKENVPSQNPKNGLTYDTHSEYMTIVVTDNNDGTKSAKVTLDEEPKFKNTYEANPIPVNPDGDGVQGPKYSFTKVLNGRDSLQNEEFSFTLEAVTAGAPMPDNATATVKDLKNGVAKDFGFGIMTFDKAGTFEYVVKENVPSPNPKDGLTYDTHSAKLKIIVTDNSDLGKLEAKVEVTDKTFTNNYEAKPVDFDTNDVNANQLFTKEVVGRNWKNGETFNFSVSKDSVNGETSGEAFDNMPMPEVENVAVTTPADGSNLAKFGFGTLTFNKAGVYKYTITEENAGDKINGLTYDPESAVLTITVTDDNKGNLVASHSVTKDKFTNVYKAGTGTFDPAKAQTQFTKQLTGRDWNDTDKFKFVITPENGAPAPAVSEVEVTKPATGNKVNFNFGNIVFEAEGTYTYDVVEVIPGDSDPSKIKGVTYDNHHAKMTVEVTDNKDGELVATATFDKPEFVNTYKAAPVDYDTEGTEATAKFAKVLTGRPWLDSDSFTFNIKANGKAPMPVDADGNEVKTATVTKPENGNTVNFDFGTIRFEEAGTYSYAVTEVKPESNNMIPGITYDEHEAKLTIKVKDNKDGNLEIESVSLGNGTFTNSYKAGSVDVTPVDANAPLTKKLTGREWKNDDSFSFTISKLSVNEKTEGEAFDKMPMPKDNKVTVTKPAAGNETTFAFGSIKFTSEGTYKYKVVEDKAGQKINGLTYSSNAATITVNVTDKDFDGALEAEVSVENPLFENIYKASSTTVNTASDLFSKQLIGRDSKTDEAFNFNITAVTAGAPMPNSDTTSVDELENGVAKDFGFGVIKFEEEGTYIYNVVEENAGKTIDGLTYASNTATLKVSVTDNDNGELSAAATVENGLFKNIYNAEVDLGKLGANFNITKSLSGRDMAQDQFSFEIKSLDADSEKALGIPAAGETVKSPAANMDENAVVKVINNLKFTEKDSNKTYTFTVRELGNAPAGYVYDQTVYTVNIKIDDLKNGNLKATATVLAGDKVAGEHSWTSESKDVEPVVLAFKNAYSADNNNSPAVVNATKTLNGRKLKANEFSFQIKDVNGKVVRKAKNAANGAVEFGNGFTYNIDELNKMVKNGLATKKVEAGKNVFTIPYTAEEVGDMPAGVTMTAGNFSFNIEVTDNGDGTLAADVVYPEGGIKFVNTYATGTDGSNEAPLQIIGNKVISADDGLVPPAIDGKFNFTMTGDENAPLPENATVTNDAAGQITFGNIKYTLDMLKDVEPAEDGSRSRTFNYTVTETGLVPGITNDANNTRTFSVTLTDDGVGNLTATPSDSAKFTFTNTYGVVETDPTSIADQIKITKKLTGRDLVAEEFKFELVDNKNEVVATGTNDADGKVVFTPMTYDKPGKFTYTVREVANAEYDGVDYDETLFIVNTEVKDNSDGTLSVVHSADGEVVFNNKYSAGKTSVVIGAAKKLIGSDLKDGQFEFELKDEEGKVVSTAVNDKDGNILFDELTYDEDGTYKYTISEVNSGEKYVKYDDTVFNVTVDVTDDKKGNLVATVETDAEDGAVFVNTYKKPQNPQVPPQSDDGVDTGDENPTSALVMFIGAAILMLGALVEKRKISHK